MSVKTEVTKDEFDNFINNYSGSLERNQYNETTSYHDFAKTNTLEESWVACEVFGYDNVTKYYIYKEQQNA